MAAMHEDGFMALLEGCTQAPCCALRTSRLQPALHRVHQLLLEHLQQQGPQSEGLSAGGAAMRLGMGWRWRGCTRLSNLEVGVRPKSGRWAGGWATGGWHKIAQQRGGRTRKSAWRPKGCGGTNLRVRQHEL
jgi:hypothetical protein